MRLRSYLRGLGAGIFASAVLMGIATSSTKGGMTDEEIKQRAAQLGMVEEEAVLVKPGTEEKPADISVSAPEAAAPDDKQKAEAEKEQDKKDPEPEKAETGDVKADNKEKDNKEAVEKENEKKEAEDKASDEAGKADTVSAPENEDLAMGGNSGDAAKDKGDAAKDQSEAAKDQNDTSKDQNEDTSKDSYTLQIAAGSSSYTVANLLKKGGVIDDADDFDKYLCDNGYDHRINHGVFKIPAGADYEQIARMITGNK